MGKKGCSLLLYIAVYIYIKELANVKVLLTVVKETKGSNKQTCLPVLKATVFCELYHPMGAPAGKFPSKGRFHLEKHLQCV